MNIPEKLEPQESSCFFYTKSELASELFFYPLCVGRENCAPGYRIDRNRYDSFLVMYIRSGNGYVIQNHKELPFHQGDFVLVDCYGHHCYGSHTGCFIEWLHFDGVLARRYFELCIKNGPIIRGGYLAECQLQLKKIYDMFANKKKINEPQLSSRITYLLTELMQVSAGLSHQPESISAVEQMVSYISEHLNESMTIEELAKKVSLSPYYFLRLFKKETGYTPHEYIIRSRIDKAKYLLKSTQEPLKKIAADCGFGDTSRFSHVFKDITKMTPQRYRNS